MHQYVLNLKIFCQQDECGLTLQAVHMVQCHLRMFICCSCLQFPVQTTCSLQYRLRQISALYTTVNTKLDHAYAMV